MSSDKPEGSASGLKQTIFAIGSGITAIGFWGLAIDVSLQSYVFQTSVILRSANIALFFSVLFVIGLVAMGVCSLKRVGARG